MAKLVRRKEDAQDTDNETAVLSPQKRDAPYTGNILSADNAVRHRWNSGTTTFEFTALKCCWAINKA